MVIAVGRDRFGDGKEFEESESGLMEAVGGGFNINPETRYAGYDSSLKHMNREDIEEISREILSSRGCKLTSKRTSRRVDG